MLIPASVVGACNTAAASRVLNACLHLHPSCRRRATFPVFDNWHCDVHFPGVNFLSGKFLCTGYAQDDAHSNGQHSNAYLLVK